MTSTTKLYNGQHIQDFAHYYRNTAAKYMVEHGFGIEQEYDHVNTGIYKVKPVMQLKKSASFSGQISYTLESEIRNKINVDVLNNQNIYWDTYLYDFYRDLYLNANSINRTIMQKEGFLTYTLLDVCKALKQHPKELIEFVRNSIEENANLINSPVYLKSVMDIWQQNLPKEDFNSLVVEFFTTNKKNTVKNKNLVTVEYVFENNVDDEDTYQQLIKLLPAKKDSSIFVEDNLNIYEVVVSRQILSQKIKLPEKDYYNDMNINLAKLFNDNAEKLNLVEVSLPVKVKSAKEFRFLVKAKPESSYTKEKFQKALVGLYQEYEAIASSVEFKFQISNHLTNEWFMKSVLSGLIPEKDNTQVMRKKI